MIKIILVLCTILCCTSKVIGQSDNLILTDLQNLKWFDSLEKTVSLDRKLEMINSRLLSDTNVFVNYSDRIKVIDQVENKSYGIGKPLVVINGIPMAIENNTDNQEIIKLTKLLNSTNIASIELLSNNNPAAAAIYGTRGLYGIIIMTLKNKKLLKKFKRIHLQGVLS